MTLTYVSGEQLPRPDTVRLCLRGLALDNLVLSEPLTRAGRRLIHEVGMPPRTYTLDGSPSGVIVQLNGSELRPCADPESYVMSALRALREYWLDITMPRIDWAVQLSPERFSLDDVVGLAMACGYLEASASENRMRYVIGSGGVSRYLYWRRSRQVQVGDRRSCTVDRVELLIYTATCDRGLPWLRVESREYMSSRDPGYHCHPLTQSLMVEIGQGLVVPESEDVRAVAVDRKRATRRGLSMLLADNDLPVELLAQLAQVVYGPLYDLGLLQRYDRLRRYVFLSDKKIDHDVAADVATSCAGSRRVSTEPQEVLSYGVQDSDDPRECRQRHDDR